MNFKLEELGSIRAHADLASDVFAESVWHAQNKLGTDVKDAVRADTKQSGIKRSARLANSWRGRMFPQFPKAHARKPAYVLGSNAPHVVDTFEEGPVINARGGGLLIPIGVAKRIKLRIGQKRSDLKFEVMRIYGVSRLSMGRMKKTGELVLGVYSAAEGGKMKFLPAFRLAKSVQAPRLLKGNAIIKQMAAAMPSRHSDETARQFEKRLYNATQGKGHVWRTTFDSRAGGMAMAA